MHEEMGTLEFFRSMQHSFIGVLSAGRRHPHLIDAVAEQALDLYERNLSIHLEGTPPIACFKGCSACCRLKVTATAPEILYLARYIRRIQDTPVGARLDLVGRIAEANLKTQGLDEQDRLKLKISCPLLFRGACVIHSVRPLACRGHASFDKKACAAVVAGRDVEVPVSESHAFLRSLVQGALSSALRSEGYAWAGYELIHGLHLALSDEQSATAWLTGIDAFAPARSETVDWADLGTVMDTVDASAV